MTQRDVSRRMTFGVVAWLLGLSAIAWFSTVRQVQSMRGMLPSLVDLGAGGHGAPSVPMFVGMWIGMMVAMMFPAVVPMVLAHRMVVQRRGESERSTAVFVAGYLLVWSAAGTVPLALLLWFWDTAASAGDARWLSVLAGLVVAGAGAYQFTPWKALCLKTCRSPLGFILTHDFGRGSRSSLRAGLEHGAFCLGCCWALMTVLVVMGMMNLYWMVALALIFLAEKNWRHGLGLTRVMGGSLITLGLAIVAFPGVLPAVTEGPGPMHHMDMGMHM